MFSVPLLVVVFGLPSTVPHQTYNRPVSPVRALVQSAGPALRMSRARFRTELACSPPLQRVLPVYIHSLREQISQPAVCNRFHVVESRLARWLLMTRDRVGAGEFRMTQKFLSSMVGGRREGVTEAASRFQRQKLDSLQSG
jgi:CRP-like cAMP-binding protein